MQCPECGADVCCQSCGHGRGTFEFKEVAKRIEFSPGKQPSAKMSAMIILQSGCSLDGPREYLREVEKELADLVTKHRAAKKGA